MLGISKKSTYLSVFLIRLQERVLQDVHDLIPYPEACRLYNLCECLRETGKDQIVLPQIIVKVLTDRFVLSWDISWKK